MLGSILGSTWNATQFDCKCRARVRLDTRLDSKFDYSHNPTFYANILSIFMSPRSWLTGPRWGPNGGCFSMSVDLPDIPWFQVNTFCANILSIFISPRSWLTVPCWGQNAGVFPRASTFLLFRGTVKVCWVHRQIWVNKSSICDDQ